MQPEPVAPGFIATPHRRVGGEPEVRLGPGKLHLDGRHSARGDGAHQREVIEAGRAGEAPLAIAEFEGDR